MDDGRREHLALLVVGLAVVAVVALLRLNSGSGRGVSRPSALDLLDQRYARGEIDDDEYFRRLSVLDSTGPARRRIIRQADRLAASAPPCAMVPPRRAPVGIYPSRSALD